MTRGEAIFQLREEPLAVEPGQRVAIEGFEPADAWGVARLFHAVYGDGYPIDTYYIPDKLCEENASGRLYSVVARTPSGDIVGHMGMYSHAPFPLLLEAGLGLVLPSYRATFVNVAYRMSAFLTEELAPHTPVQALMGEAVCAHLMIQKMAVFNRLLPVGLELGLIPAGVYDSTGNRTTCLLQFRSYVDAPQRVYIPALYEEHARFIYAGLGIEREFAVAEAALPEGRCETTEQTFDSAGVARCSVASLAQDFPAMLGDFESRTAACAARQLFLNLSQPQVEGAVDYLRGQGWFFCGFMPRWFDSDALVMQKLAAPTDYDSVQLLEERSKRILELVREDRRRCTDEA